RRIEDDARAPQRREPRRLGVPLVPADQRSDPAHMSFKGPESEISGCEVELLVVTGVVRDVHLPVDPDYLPVRANDRRAVVIEAGGSLLKKRNDHGEFLLSGDLPERFRGGPG